MSDKMALKCMLAFVIVISSDLVSGFYVGKDEIETILVQMACRHGDRSPANFYPNYKHKSFWEKLGMGELTTEGRKMIFENGQNFQSQWYPGFLSDAYAPEEVAFFSSDKNRAYESAQTFTAGLFAITDETKIDGLPVKRIGMENDYYIHGTKCPAKDATVEEIESSGEYQEFLSRNKQFTTELCRSAGWDEAECTTKNLRVIEDDVICDKSHGLELPEWATETSITELADFLDKHRSFHLNSTKLNYLTGGPLLGWISNHMESSISQESKTKLFYFSGHDTTIMPVLSALGLRRESNPLPHYGSCALIELMKNSEDKYFVKVSFRNSTIGMAEEEVLVSGCSDIICEYEIFLETLKPLINADPETTCKN